jgi:hypothetical protein
VRIGADFAPIETTNSTYDFFKDCASLVSMTNFVFAFTEASPILRHIFSLLHTINQWILRRIIGNDVVQRDLYYYILKLPTFLFIFDKTHSIKQ